MKPDHAANRKIRLPSPRSSLSGSGPSPGDTDRRAILESFSNSWPRPRDWGLGILIALMDPIATIVERLCAWKDVTREDVDGKDSFFVRGQIFSYLGRKGVVVKLAPPQVTEALKIQGAKRQPDDGDPHSREFVEIPVNGPREVERAMMWLRRACRLGRTAAGPV